MQEHSLVLGGISSWENSGVPKRDHNSLIPTQGHFHSLLYPTFQKKVLFWNKRQAGGKPSPPPVGSLPHRWALSSHLTHETVPLATADRTRIGHPTQARALP